MNLNYQEVMEFPVPKPKSGGECERLSKEQLMLVCADDLLQKLENKKEVSNNDIHNLAYLVKKHLLEKGVRVVSERTTGVEL